MRHTFYFAQIGGAYFEYGSIHIYVSDIILIGLLACWLAAPWKKTEWGPKAILWPLLAWLAWQMVSIVWAQDRLAAIWHVAEWGLWGAGYLYVINRVKSASHLLWPLVIGIGVQAGVGIIQYIRNSSLGLQAVGESVLNIAQGGVPVLVSGVIHRIRAAGLTPHANIFGGLLAIGSMWLLAVTQNKKITSWIVALGVLVAAGLALSFSRTAWVVWLVGLALGFVLTRVKVGRLLSFIMLVVWLMVLGSQWHWVTGRFDLTQRLEAKSVSDRVSSVATASGVWQKHPLIGTGAGNYTQELITGDQPVRPGWAYQPVPDIYLLILGELGVVGLALWLWLTGAVGWLAINLYRQKRISWWAFWSLVSWYGFGIIDHWPISLHQGWVMWFLAMGLLILESRLTYKPEGE